MTIKFLGFCLLALSVGTHAASAGTVLITRKEAALPPASTAKTIATSTRGITRRPSLVLISPVASVISPFTLKIGFRTYGGSTIRPRSFKAAYLKNPNVDLTARIMPYVTATGVKMEGAEAPPGHHQIVFKIEDSDGREGTAVFTLDVLK